METLTLQAPAKINLYLDILSRRADGYHEIIGVMQKISLCDTVTVWVSPAATDAIRLSCSEPSLPIDERNLAYRAARLYLSFFAPREGGGYEVDIRIEKRIPMEAGLAGGSTDAAAVLSALYRLCPTGRTMDDLIAASASLGADVPFCLSDGTQITEGIGERLTPCAGLPSECGILLCKTPERVSTPAAYRALDEAYGAFREKRFDVSRFRSLSDGLRTGDLLCAGEAMYNIFESVVLPDCPLSLAALSEIRQRGSVGARMSGSGPSVFGLFRSEKEAAALRDEFLAAGYEAFICRPFE